MSRQPFISQESELPKRTPQIHITVVAAADSLEFLEGQPQSLGLTGTPKCFRIRYPEVQVIVWLLGDLSGVAAYDTLQQAIRYARQSLQATINK